MTVFEVQFTSGEMLLLEGADAYQPEGAFTTFFAAGSSRNTIDSWSTRIASYRAANISSIQRCSRLLGAAADPYTNGTTTGESVPALAA
jgi:hypothetical protein